MKAAAPQDQSEAPTCFPADGEVKGVHKKQESTSPREESEEKNLLFTHYILETERFWPEKILFFGFKKL